MQKKKSGVKKCLEICAIKGGGRGVGPLMANAILNFHFDFLTPSLTLNGIYQHIQGRSNSSVISATIHTTELVISREKPFVCKHCNFTCKHLSSLRTHMFSHTGKEPYACKKCNYSCKQSGHLSRHMEKFHTT